MKTNLKLFSKKIVALSFTVSSLFLSASGAEVLTPNQETISQRVGFLTAAAPLFSSLRQMIESARYSRDEAERTAVIESIDKSAVLYRHIDWKHLSIYPIPVLNTSLTDIVQLLHPSKSKDTRFSKTELFTPLHDRLIALDKSILEEIIDTRDVFPESPAFQYGKTLGVSYILQALNETFSILSVELSRSANKAKTADILLSKINIFKNSFVGLNGASTADILHAMDSFKTAIEDIKATENKWSNKLPSLGNPFRRAQNIASEANQFRSATRTFINDIETIQMRLPTTITSQVAQLRHSKVIADFTNQIRNFEGLNYSIERVIQELQNSEVLQLLVDRESLRDIKKRMERRLVKFREWKSILASSGASPSNSELVLSVMAELAKTDADRIQIEKWVAQPDLIDTERNFVDALMDRNYKILQTFSASMPKLEVLMESHIKATQCLRFYSK